MQKSARILGEEYGVSAPIMNRILKKQGFLEGEPNAYKLTPKGLLYGKEFQSDTAYDYVLNNRVIPKRTYDDSIKEVLIVNKEVLDEVIQEMIAEEAAKKEAKEAAKRAAEEAAKKAAEATALEIAERDKIINTVKRAGIISLGVLGTGLLIYVVTTRVKRRLESKKEKQDKGIEEISNN